MKSMTWKRKDDKETLSSTSTRRANDPPFLFFCEVTSP